MSKLSIAVRANFLRVGMAQIKAKTQCTNLALQPLKMQMKFPLIRRLSSQFIRIAGHWYHAKLHVSGKALKK
jgi:hypothetical protein